VHAYQHEAAVLDVCWISEKLAASAALDRRVRLLDTHTGQSNIIGKHTNAVNTIRYCPDTKLLITTSWDQTLQLWSVEEGPSSAPRSLHIIELPAKPLAVDISTAPASEASTSSDFVPRLVVAMTTRRVHVYETRKLRAACDRHATKEDEAWKPAQVRDSSLKFMTRDLKCMPDGTGFAASSIEGRIAVEFFEDDGSKKYAFKCHRQVVDGVDTVYPVNAMCFHPTHGTFASLGGDAFAAVWDAAARKRRMLYQRFPSPLSAGAVSGDGLLFAVASGTENIEDAQHGGEVGGIGKGGEGNVRIHIHSAVEDFKVRQLHFDPC
ncbi:WD40 repeat-like protein, partial [Ceraceosorus guamensis]